MVEVAKKRNLSVVAHHGAGKTSLVEAFLFMNGKLDRLGRTNDGNTFSDFTDEEKDRKVSIHSSLIHFEYNKHAINLLDLPGYADFIAEVRGCLRASDAALFVINATSPVEVETEKAWEYADEFKLPRIAVVNQLDKERADFGTAVEAMRKMWGAKCVPIQVPIGKESGFKGIVDLIGMKAFSFDDRGKAKPLDSIPADCQELIDKYREMMFDCAAEVDESVMEKYLGGEELTRSELVEGLKKATLARSCVPILCASAFNAIGTQPILDAIVDFLPAPDYLGKIEGKRPGSDDVVSVKLTPEENFSAFIFKTRIDPHAGRLSFARIWSGTLKPDSPILNSSTGEVLKVHNILQVNGKEQTIIAEATAGDIISIAKHDELKTMDSLCATGNPIVFAPTSLPPNVIQMAIRPTSKGEEEKLSLQLQKLEAEDPSLHVRRDAETNETIISGMGELHLDTVVYHMKHYAKLDVELSTPKVAYRETVTAHAEGSHRHKKQSGGRGQFAEVHFKIDPQPAGAGYEFVDAIVGGVVPGRFIPAVEKGINEALKRGIQAGYPVVDVKVTLFDGKDHPVDSSEAAFKIAAAICFRNVAKNAKPILLEPIVSLEVEVPEEYLGDAMSDISSKRGRVMGMESANGKQIIRAFVPLAEMFRYSIDLRAITRGRGQFRMTVDHYEQVPAEVAQKIIESATLEDIEE